MPWVHNSISIHASGPHTASRIPETLLSQGARVMGSKWFTGGVSAAPSGRIRFDVQFEGVRYRPTVKRPPSEANLRRARERLATINQQIEVGTFSFAEEFPDYRFLRRINGTARVRSCDAVF